jgi:Tfp pilus assembly protein PilO
VNAVREYRVPLLIGAGTLVVVLLLWVALISPQNTKLSNLQGQETQLQTQQSALQAKLAALRTEQQKLSTSCADLQKISTQIPSVQSPIDIDAEESSFESQFNALTASSGVTLTQFSGFAPATSTSGSSAASSPASGTTSPSGSAAAPNASGVTAVPTTLALTGNYGQVVAFVNGLDSFPRLFVIQTFKLSTGATSSPSGTASSASSAASAASATGGAPLWTGGTATPASAGPYTLSIVGSIFYTSSPNALAACSRATAEVKG